MTTTAELAANDAKHRCNTDLYNALMKGDEDKVIELCRKIPEGPLHILTIHNDTVLHMAAYSKRNGLVLRLLKELPDSGLSNQLTHQNETGNTILHEAATANQTKPAAEEMLRRALQLLSMRNRRGETATFMAARYGKTKMFEYLAGEVGKIPEDKDVDRKDFFQREDKTNVLHITVVTEHFELALSIARTCEFLIGEQDRDGMTGLQLLACNPSAFRSGIKHGFLKRLIYSCGTSENRTARDGEGQHMEVHNHGSLIFNFLESCCRLPMSEAIQKEKQRYESALNLAKFLIKKDTSWVATKPRIGGSKPQTHKYGNNPKASFNEKGEGEGDGPSTAFLGQGEGEGEVESSPEHYGTRIRRTGDTPLFLAAMSGIVEIVEEILNVYPQAVEHINNKARNILHVAIKYRQIEILNLVEKKEMAMRRLIRKIDYKGNSILHMVGKKIKGYIAEKAQGPAIQLQEELLLFEHVKEISSSHFIKHHNLKKQTADELFAITNDQLRTEAKEWLKRTAENCSIVAILIATVAFAAAYTVPGGPNQMTGFPILLHQPFFVVFTMTDVLSLTFALTSVVTFLSILTSSFQLKDFKQSLPQKLMLGFTFLILSVSLMMLAFAATIILMIRNKERWTHVVLYFVAFLPVTIFALSYLPLYLSLMKTFKHLLKSIVRACPRCNCAPLLSWITNLFNYRKSQTTNPTNHQNQKTGSTRSPTPQTTRSPI